MKIKFDSYSLKVRLLPVLLVFLPLGMVVMAWFPGNQKTYGLLIGLTTTCVLTVFLSELGRDQGKRKEPELFKEWGGNPSVQLLRYRNTIIDLNTKERYHKKLNDLVPGIRLPTESEENENHENADAIYESCTRFLREATRDKDRFSILYSELAGYGFRRNSWGVKGAGIILSVIGTLGCITKIVFDIKFGNISNETMAATAISLSLLLWWIFQVKKTWIEWPAFEYACALLAACDELSSDRL